MSPATGPSAGSKGGVAGDEDSFSDYLSEGSVAKTPIGTETKEKESQSIAPTNKGLVAGDRDYVQICLPDEDIFEEKILLQPIKTLDAFEATTSDIGSNLPLHFLRGDVIFKKHLDSRVPQLDIRQANSVYTNGMAKSVKHLHHLK